MKMIQMLCGVCIVGALMSSPSHAEPVMLTIPGEGWRISFDAPSITRFQGDSKKAGFRYQGMSEDGFNISIFVEEKKGVANGHKACADHYWPLAKRNPMIDQSTVAVTEEKDFIKVSYRIRGEQEGIKFDVPNINLYFEYNGKWIDVHISKFPFKDVEQKMLDGFVTSLKYERSSQQNSGGDSLKAAPQK